MDASLAGRITPVEDSSSHPSETVAVPGCAERGIAAAGSTGDALNGHGGGGRLAAVALYPPATERRSAPGAGRRHVLYACPPPSLVPGFAEPPREPGPKPPAAAKGNQAGDELAGVAEAFVGMPLVDIERLVIEATIRACGGSLPKAARVLGVSPSTLYRKRAGWSDRSNTP